ncbi:flagellar basal body rod protein FlgC [Inmirania thermothiophila]|uniref:Flagellar basal-body rod protein FlgC n=1 Tax=Inmirania thermothiophila TaxID=1750597 RepID=A0A3N1YBZ4_9GAMM|nr:flagellar basal body rod protein FlgC [Inmirania thermothiophila]ROR34907.1 flagellar basal-body rod protein FlgC [Inmirania thermothiophila]
MSLMRILDISAQSLAAQSVRLNVTASNLANANSEAGSPEAVYRPRHPVFAAVLDAQRRDPAAVGVRVAAVVESQAPPEKRYDPGHPLADAQGYVYLPRIEVVEEMADMISASRSYEASVEVFNTAKELALRTLALGQ